MFVLNAKDVHYCQLGSGKLSSTKTYPGIFYRGFLFVRVASYTQNQFQNAIEKCRKFLEREEPITSIIVKETDNITLWCENKKLKLLVPEQELASKTKKTVIKYRGTEIIKEVKQIQIDPQQIVNRRKKMKYRGSNYQL